MVLTMPDRYGQWALTQRWWPRATSSWASLRMRPLGHRPGCSHQGREPLLEGVDLAGPVVRRLDLDRRRGDQVGGQHRVGDAVVEDDLVAGDEGSGFLCRDGADADQVDGGHSCPLLRTSHSPSNYSIPESYRC